MLDTFVPIFHPLLFSATVVVVVVDVVVVVVKAVVRRNIGCQKSPYFFTFHIKYRSLLTAACRRSRGPSTPFLFVSSFANFCRGRDQSYKTFSFVIM